MNVRTARFLLILALGILLAPLAADAQQATKVPRIGYLSPGAPGDFRIEAFRRGLREFGYVEGQNILLEGRWAGGRNEALPQLAAELVRLKVNLIVIHSSAAARAVQKATTTIPIVIAGVGDPVGIGLVASLARPGGNITGSSILSPELSGKRLELLKEAVPAVSRVAMLRNPNNPAASLASKETEAAARRLGVQLQVLEVRRREEIDGAVLAMIRERADALIVLPDPMVVSLRERLADLALKNRLPAIFEQREHAEAGGLMAYGASLTDSIRRAAYFVDKILKGAKPGDLPVEQPTKFELVINLKTAKALGLTIPQSVLIRADEVIQ